MRSIQRRFEIIKNQNPYWSDYICFAESVVGMDFGRPSLSRWFNKLIEKDDYDKKDRNQISEFLVDLSVDKNSKRY